MTNDLALQLFILPPLEEAAAVFSRPAIATPIACKHVLAIGLQESGMVETIQRGIGGRPMPDLARGWHQFEKRGGVAEVIAHSSIGWVRTQIVKMGYPLDPGALHYALAYDQRLSSLCARGLLWMDPAALVDDREVAFEIYLRRWRPGAWTRGDAEARADLRARWSRSWQVAGEAVARMEPAERLVPRMPEPEPESPAEPDSPSKWPVGVRRWVVRRIRTNISDAEYWTALHVGPQRECNPVVALDITNAERWVSKEAAFAAIKAYDDRMLGQGFEVVEMAG